MTEENKTSSRLIGWLHRVRERLRPWAESPIVPVACFVIAGVIIYFFFPRTTGSDSEQISVVLTFFRGLRENLPLTLPLLSTFLSLMLNIRDLVKPHGWLKVALPAALGLVSFAIWYVVASQSTTDDYLRIGQHKVLSREYSVLLLVLAFIWAGFAAIGRVIGESQPEGERGWRWYGAQALLLVVSLVGLSVPFFLFETKTAVEARLQRSLDEAEFSVSVPFRDPSLDQHLGRVADPLTQAEVFRVQARTAEEAIHRAKELFAKSPLSGQKYGRTRDSDPVRSVEVLDSWVVAERQAGASR